MSPGDTQLHFLRPSNSAYSLDITASVFDVDAWLLSVQQVGNNLLLDADNQRSSYCTVNQLYCSPQSTPSTWCWTYCFSKWHPYTSCCCGNVVNGIRSKQWAEGCAVHISPIHFTITMNYGSELKSLNDILVTCSLLKKVELCMTIKQSQPFQYF